MRLRIALFQGCTIVVFSALIALLHNSFAEKGLPLMGSTDLYADATSDTSTVTKITLAEAYKLHGKKDNLFIDTRSETEFKFGHIKGAVSLPLEDFDTTFPKIQKNLKRKKTLVVYCGGSSCGLSTKLAKRLKAKGFSNVGVLAGGWPEWLKANYPIEKAETKEKVETKN